MLMMNGQSNVLAFLLVIVGFVDFVDIGFVDAALTSDTSLRPCPDLNRPKWSKGATNALMNSINNQQKISLKRCLPEVTDFSCARLSR